MAKLHTSLRKSKKRVTVKTLLIKSLYKGTSQTRKLFLRNQMSTCWCLTMWSFRISIAIQNTENHFTKSSRRSPRVSLRRSWIRLLRRTTFPSDMEKVSSEKWRGRIRCRSTSRRSGRAATSSRIVLAVAAASWLRRGKASAGMRRSASSKNHGYS